MLSKLNLTPRKVVCRILYKYVMYADISLKINSPFRCISIPWLHAVWTEYWQAFFTSIDGSSCSKFKRVSCCDTVLLSAMFSVKIYDKNMIMFCICLNYNFIILVSCLKISYLTYIMHCWMLIYIIMF